MMILLKNLSGTINGICFLNVLLGLAFLTALLAASSWGYNTAAGWIAVTGASVIFGATGIPFKTPSLDTISPDPIIFAFFSSLGIFLVSVPLSVVVVILWNKDDNNIELHYQPWSILGSLDILVTTFLAFQTVQQVGYAKGPAIWATVGMVFSFCIGAFVFDETITHMVSAVLSIPSLITGMLLIISCQPNKAVATVAAEEHAYSTIRVDEEDGTKHESGLWEGGEIELKTVNGCNQIITTTDNIVRDASITKKRNNQRDDSSLCNKQNSLGLVLGILTGIVDGSLMVPFKMTGSSTMMETYQYLVSFGFSSLVTTPVVLALYYIYLSIFEASGASRGENESAFSKKQMRLSMIPGVLNGVLWGLANTMSVTATFHLSMRIAFPLTQTCVMFATCWGIFYFHEIKKSKETLVKMMGGFGFFMLGTILLAESAN